MNGHYSLHLFLSLHHFWEHHNPVSQQPLQPQSYHNSRSLLLAAVDLIENTRGQLPQLKHARELGKGEALLLTDMERVVLLVSQTAFAC